MGYLAIGAVFIILVFITLVLPLSLTKISRMIILSVGLFIAYCLFFIQFYLQFWQIGMIALLLISCAGYFLVKYIPIQEENRVEQPYSYISTIQFSHEETKKELVEEVHEIEVEQYEVIELEDDLEQLFNYKKQLSEKETEKLENETKEEFSLDNLTFEIDDLQDKLY